MTLSDLILFVEHRLDVPRGSVLARDRHPSIALARQLAAWMLRHHRYPQPSTSEIGKMLGRDHSTIVNALRRIDRKRQAEPRFRELTDRMLADAARIAWPELETTRMRVAS